jgi:hypothetical protein
LSNATISSKKGASLLNEMGIYFAGFAKNVRSLESIMDHESRHLHAGCTDQNVEMQIRELNEYVERQGWDVFATYQDVTSGAKANRPRQTQFMANARMKRSDVLLCWKLNRFDRSLVDCLNNIQELA